MSETHPLIRLGGPLLGAVLAILVIVVAVGQFRTDQEAAQQALQVTDEPAIDRTDDAAATSGDAVATIVPDQPVASSAVVAAFTTGGCAGCHVIPGVLGANGRVGPDLSLLGTVAAERIAGLDAEAYIRQSILDPNAFIAPDCNGQACPANVMPQAFGPILNEQELAEIVDYLAVLGTDDAAALFQEQAPTVILPASLPAESVMVAFAELPSTPNEAQAALGRVLFFDKRLSGNGSLSCASCHQPEKGFTDGQALSDGYPSTSYFRNTPTILNTAFASSRYWDGRMDGGDLPTLVRDHIAEAHFMSMDGRLLVERINQAPAYVALYQEAFGGEPSYGRTLNAISAYVSTLNSPPGPYDAALAGDTSLFSADEAAGFALFRGEAGCSDCHSGALLSDEAFHNTGVGSDIAMLDDPERAVTFRRFFRTLGTPGYRNLREDPGRYAIWLNEADRGAFNTPSLREVGRTAPYMHNGSLDTLEEVVAFYDGGGGAGQSAGLAPLGLSDTEMRQLVAFLWALDSDPVTIDAPILPNYELLPLGGK